MGLTLTAKPDKAPLIPAVLHVDDTARLQTVAADRSGCELYRRLISAFYRLTGVPMVVRGVCARAAAAAAANGE